MLHFADLAMGEPGKTSSKRRVCSSGRIRSPTQKIVVMAEKRHLKNAPIREGLVDIHFEPPVPMEVLKSFEAKVRSRFSESKTLWQQAVGFEMAKGGGVTRQEATQSAIGYRLADATRVLICRTNGFTYSRLPQYLDWDDLRQAAKSLWDEFLHDAKPQIVTRLAVRYINVLPLPMGDEDFSEYLEAGPIIPKGLPQGLASFLHRVVMIDPAGNRQAIVTQALESTAQVGKTVDVILDIDAIRALRIESASDQVWLGLEALRDFKNDIFFQHITERTARLFE